jgi:hypothetical protein
MPASVKKQGDKYRVVEPGGGIMTNKTGTAVDGGGFRTEKAAQRQATAINMRKATTTISK